MQCHEKEAAEWQASRHRTSLTNDEFAEAYLTEPLKFCRDCHAPESALFPSLDADAIGVACITCHLPGDAVLAAPKPFFATGLAPHRVVRDPAFSTSDACKGCHEFSFPDEERRVRPLLMQTTVSEHRTSGEARSCADCHMPAGSHTFESTRSPAAHRAAVSVRAERSGPTTLRVTLESHDVGHAYPTGDLFRRVRVSAKAVVEELFVVGTDERFLQRSFGDGLGVGHVVLREQVADTRLRPGEATIVDLELGSRAESARIEWRVVLERVQHVRDGEDEGAAIADSVELAAGSMSP